MIACGILLGFSTQARARSALESSAPDSLILRNLEAAESRFGTQSLQAADLIDALIESRCRREDAILWSDETAALAARGVAIRTTYPGRDSLDLARSLDRLGFVQWHHQKFAAAQATLERALSHMERALDPDDPVVAEARWHLGKVLLTRGDYSGARSLFQRTLDSHARRATTGDESAVLCFRDLGLATERIAGPAAAGIVLDSALVVAESSLGPDHPAVADILLILAEMREQPETAQRAIAILDRALPPGHWRHAEARSILGGIRRSRYEFAVARPLLEESLADVQKVLGTEHLKVARMTARTGILYYNTWSPKALPLLERALGIQERLLGPDHLDVARTLRWIGLDLAEKQTQYDPARARQCFLRVLRIFRKVLPPDHPDTAAMLFILSISCLDQKEYAEGLAFAEECVAMEERIYTPERSGWLAWRLEILASAQDAVGRTALAAQTMEKGLEVDMRDGSRDWAILRHAADIFRHAGMLDRSYECALAGEKGARETFMATVRSMTEHEALRFTSYRADFLPALLALAAERLPSEAIRAVWDALICGRALVLDEMLSRNRMQRGTDSPEILRLIAEADSARIRLAEIVVRGPGDSGREEHERELAEARSVKESAERSLGALGGRYRTATLRDKAGFDDVAKALPSKCGLVAYVRFLSWIRYGESITRYMAFVLPGSEKDPVAIDLGDAAAIDTLAAAWRREAESSPGLRRERAEESCRRAGERLRQAVWDPVAPWLDSLDGVFFVPDGSLNTVNLNALPAGADRYLVETDPWIHMLPAEKDLAVFSAPDPAAADRPEGGLLALGDPDYEARFAGDLLALDERRGRDPAVSGQVERRRSACADMASIWFESLPATGEEARLIAETWPPSKAGDLSGTSAITLRGREATEASFKRFAPGRSIVHIASHGFFFDGRCRADESVTGLGDFRRGFVTGDSLLDENPLLRSGIALAGANHHSEAGRDDEDGLLTAEEIATLDLDGVRWVVLSACETGLGAIESMEGVMGLPRAFQTAGVRSVIMSLWTIGDEPTRDWMAALYESRLRGKCSTAESVRNAGRRVLAQRRAAGRGTHPFYWGAFVASGDWR